MNLRPRMLQLAPLTPRYPLYATPAGLHVHSLGSSPFARRYLGNHCCFLFLGVLRCFSSPGALRAAYAFSRRSLPTTEEGFPHSETLGSTPAYGSPRHFGVRPVLLRHLAPRHPPCALPTLSYGCRSALHRGVSSVTRSVTYLNRTLPLSLPSLPCDPGVSLPLMIRYLVVKEPPEASNEQARACPLILQN